ncbi:MULTISPECIES: YehS family protein [Bacillus]|uniref:DUF1456 family protein n=1 Tax=Bacillus TaxID=1386 RepID=UPI000BB902E7|nr:MULTISPECIES: DUF1456 family protein [Bacillus]
MTNNDILIRLRYALDIRDIDMIEIFKLGGVDVTKEEVQKMLSKPVEDEYNALGELIENDEYMSCNNKMLESFLNGFITFKRGKQEPKPGQPEFPPLTNEHVNNMLLKKVKIALALTSEDMLEIIEEPGSATISKGELGAFLRKKGHKNYKECGDKYARNFLKGLALKHRG